MTDIKANMRAHGRARRIREAVGAVLSILVFLALFAAVALGNLGMKEMGVSPFACAVIDAVAVGMILYWIERFVRWRAGK